MSIAFAWVTSDSGESLSAVVPAVLGKSRSYDGMLVANGNAVQRAFEELIATNLPQQERHIGNG